MSVNITALREAQDQGLTVGVVPENESRPVLRLEIDDFIQDVELANLYFLALERFMSEEESYKPFSYAEISGIHGQPYRAWNDVNSVSFENSGNIDRTAGYCSHGSAIFPTWHRAYLAQFEQALFLIAADIAPLIGSEAALARFRLPYFDPLLPRQKDTSQNRWWSRNREQEYIYGIPIIMTLPEIRLRRPEAPNEWHMSPNPLYSFRFPRNQGFGWNFNQYTRQANIPAATDHTIRGLSQSDNLGNANHTWVMQTFDTRYDPYTTMSSSAPSSLYRVMFDPSQNWVTMSNHYWRQGNGSIVANRNSLEGFHDNIHGELGGYGHMSNPDFAGFDPAFWLHHCNIDRLLAIWQGLHSQDPESQQWWTSLWAPLGTFVEPANQQETPETPLAPFRKSWSGSQAVWWTSNDVRNHLKMGYDYPETAAARQDSDGYVAGLRKWANKTLGWADPSTSWWRRTAPDEDVIRDLEDSVDNQIPFFPSRVLVDGRNRLSDTIEFIGSKAPRTQSDTATRSISIATRNLAPDVPDLLTQKERRAVMEEGSASQKTKVKELKVEKQGELEDVELNIAASKSNDTHGSSRRNFIEISQAVVSAFKEKNGHTPLILKKHADPEKIHIHAIERAIPIGKTSFKDRFHACSRLIKDREMTQWHVSFSVDKFALGGPFTIYFFLGDFPTTPEEWMIDPHLAGSSFVFASSRERIENGNCENCKKKKEAGLRYADTVSLTPALLVYFHSGEEVHGRKVTDLEPNTIVPFLQRNLHWRIASSQGDEAPRESVPSLKVMVYSETVHLPYEVTDAPAFSDQTVHYSVTNGRPTGLADGEIDIVR